MVDDHDVVTDGDQLRALVARAKVTLIGYRQLRDLQRATSPSGRGISLD
jgi:hypothetical protein